MKCTRCGDKKKPDQLVYCDCGAAYCSGCKHRSGIIDVYEQQGCMIILYETNCNRCREERS
jgi:hypothetical protein